MERQLAALALAALVLSSCSSDDDLASSGPPVGPAPALTFSTGGLTPGVIWQLNRPIELTFDAPIDFAQVTGFQVRIAEAATGDAIDGILRPGIDLVTGEDRRNVVVLQPRCPVTPDDPPGLEPDRVYRLTVLGSDTSSFPVVGQAGGLLEETLELDFRTPPFGPPSTLYVDLVPGPPGFVVRGTPGVATAEQEALRLEVGNQVFGGRDYALLRAPGGGLAADPASLAAFPDGLPINHWVEIDHRTVLFLAFDQAVDPSALNLARIGVEFFDGAQWQPLPGRIELVELCGRRGTVARYFLEGTLPPDHALRIVLREGFRDLTGDPHIADATLELPVRGAEGAGPMSARLDAVFEPFSDSTMEDTASDLGAPRALWGPRVLTGIEAGDGVSRARSRWYAVGAAGRELGAAPVRPRYRFDGVDDQGRIPTAAGSVVLDPPVLGPFPIVGVEEFAVRVAPSDLVGAPSAYDLLPSLMHGDEVRVFPAAPPFTDIETIVFSAELSGIPSEARLFLGSGCYTPAGVGSDCVPWDLRDRLPDPSSARFEVVPRSFLTQSLFRRDFVGADARVTFLFDATTADDRGRPDPNEAYSAGGAWVTDPSVFSEGDWDFIRFEVLFELDVSGDGFDPLERAASIDFVKIPIDFRR
ncbi:MAG: hypothetical protein AAFP22_01120 [Planctomycetota bacterium]